MESCIFLQGGLEHENRFCSASCWFPSVRQRIRTRKTGIIIPDQSRNVGQLWVSHWALNASLPPRVTWLVHSASWKPALKEQRRPDPSRAALTSLCFSFCSRATALKSSSSSSCPTCGGGELTGACRLHRAGRGLVWIKATCCWFRGGGMRKALGSDWWGRREELCWRCSSSSVLTSLFPFLKWFFQLPGLMFPPQRPRTRCDAIPSAGFGLSMLLLSAYNPNREPLPGLLPGFDFIDFYMFL